MPSVMVTVFTIFNAVQNDGGYGCHSGIKVGAVTMVMAVAVVTAVVAAVTAIVAMMMLPARRMQEELAAKGPRQVYRPAAVHESTREVMPCRPSHFTRSHCPPGYITG